MARVSPNEKIKLSPAEKQEIVRCLEQDKPLPEKYRFLLFGDKREVELVWNGKTNEVCNIVLPFQTIEQIDEPRDEGSKNPDANSLFDQSGRQITGWTNKLIWGDNKLILSSLKNGPLRDEIEKQGGLKLIYIDPPFDVGADFSMDIEVGDGGDTFTKRPNILEEIAYRDTWGKGADSFIAMIYERLILMRDLLAEDGSIYVHLDWNVCHYVKLALDEVFGNQFFRNEIIWKRTSARSDSDRINNIHDTIYFYSKSPEFTWNQQFQPYSEEYIEQFYTHVDPDGRRWKRGDITSPHPRPNMMYEFKGYPSPKNGWRYSKHRLEELDRLGKIHYPKDPNGVPRLKQYLDEMPGVPLQSVWTDTRPLHNLSPERLGYNTQKPEAFIETIVRASSNPGDLVADFFVGSGTTAAVAEKLGRKWIATDLGKFAIHTTRKRMIGVQRQLKADGKDYRAFELLNLGRYERQAYIGLNENLRDDEKQKQLVAKEAAFVELILRAYKAEKTTGTNVFHGKKSGRMVVVGPVNLPVTRLFVEEVIYECRQKRITKVDVLGFEFEMGLFPNVLDEARGKGIDLVPKYIPAEVFDKRAVEKDQVVFHDVAAIEVKPIVEGRSVAVKLTDFSVYYSQDSNKNVIDAMKPKGSKVIVEKGQVVKVTKDKDGVVSKERLTKQWTDWIDYWSVDFDFENRREVVQELNAETGKVEQKEGDFVFENEWQSFRTRKDRSLELTSVAKEYEKGKKRVKIAVKVVDIFGNDTMTVVDISLGGK